MNAAQKLENVEAQINALERHATNVITCPYCGIPMRAGDIYCCQLFAGAVNAILDRKEIGDQIREIEQIRENVDRQPSMVVLN